MQNISQERIEENKKVFLYLLNSIKRENSNIEGLVKYLESTDFFVAPCSHSHHLACRGGLVEHCLNVYFNLSMLNNLKKQHLDENSIKIVSLCHDFAKINYYIPYIKNEKVYSENGEKHDQMGNFDWVSSTAYKKNENCLVIGSHGETAEYITRCYIPLKLDESIAIINHMGGFDVPPSTNLSELYNRYPLAMLLHSADMISCYVDERV